MSRQWPAWLALTLVIVSYFGLRWEFQREIKKATSRVLYPHDLASMHKKIEALQDFVEADRFKDRVASDVEAFLDSPLDQVVIVTRPEMILWEQVVDEPGDNNRPVSRRIARRGIQVIQYASPIHYGSSIKEQLVLGLPEADDADFAKQVGNGIRLRCRDVISLAELNKEAAGVKLNLAIPRSVWQECSFLAWRCRNNTPGYIVMRDLLSFAPEARYPRKAAEMVLPFPAHKADTIRWLFRFLADHEREFLQAGKI